MSGKMIFVNLPITDLAASTAFYKAIGCEQNMQFSNELAACMVWSESIYFMILTPDFFRTFTPKPIADAKATTEALICLSFDSREAVDKVTEAAAAGGGAKDVRPPQDMGFMYSRSFADPDGHMFEPMWMDPAAAAAGPPQDGAVQDGQAA